MDVGRVSVRNPYRAAACIAAACIALASSCRTVIATEEDVSRALQTTLDNTVRWDENVHSAVLMVANDSRTWRGAAGLADPSGGVPMTSEHQFRSASSAKMMVATLTLILVEEGLVELDEPIAAYLPPAVVANLHVHDGIDYSDRVTTRHLLQHTSGLADHWFDERDEGRFLSLVLETETDRLWDPADIVAYLKGNVPPLFPPGEDIAYSDANYILIGLVIETVTGAPLHEVYRDRLFAPLGMDHTYMEFRESPRPVDVPTPLSHVFFGTLDYTSFRSISADWAGGGLVTTTADMVRFMRAFVDDRIFAQRSTRESMLEWMPMEGIMDYGLGVMRLRGRAGTVWGHMGVGQAFMLYQPELDVIFTGTLNQDEGDVGFVISSVLHTMEAFHAQLH